MVAALLVFFWPVTDFLSASMDSLKVVSCGDVRGNVVLKGLWSVNVATDKAARLALKIFHRLTGLRTLSYRPRRCLKYLLQMLLHFTCFLT